MAGAPKLTRAIWIIVILVVAAGAGFGAWAVFLRPIKVSAATIQSDVAVEVFGLEPVLCLRHAGRRRQEIMLDCAIAGAGRTWTERPT